MSNPKNILIAGTGGFAKEILHLIHDLGCLQDAKAFIEPDFIFESNSYPDRILDLPIIPYSKIDIENDSIVIGIGDSKIRRRIVEEQLKKNTHYSNLIHPTAKISPWVQMGEGAIVCANSIITVDVVIGKFCQLNLSSTIGHDCRIGDYFTTAPGVHISGDCTIGNNVYFGTGAVIKQGITICDDVTIGMGAVVTKDIIQPGVYIGNPAKPLNK